MFCASAPRATLAAEAEVEVVLPPFGDGIHRAIEVRRMLIRIEQHACEPDAAVAQLLACSHASRREIEDRHVLVASRDANRLQSELLLETVDLGKDSVCRDLLHDLSQIAAGHRGEDSRQPDASMIRPLQCVCQPIPPVHVLPEVFPAVEELTVDVSGNDIVASPCLAGLFAQDAEGLHQPELAQETRRDISQSRRDERRRRSRSGDLDRVVEVVDVMALAAADGQDGRERLSAAACSAHALLVVEALRRHVALVDCL